MTKEPDLIEISPDPIIEEFEIGLLGAKVTRPESEYLAVIQNKRIDFIERHILRIQVALTRSGIRFEDLEP